jgi:WD40 repeat protein
MHEGERVGPFRLVRLIGEGGMGVVWEAEQEQPVQRRVALKLIRSGISSPQAVFRFERERQTLARLDHPGIAKMFDAGTLDDGRPYFVMELIEGVPVTRFCDQRRATIEERLLIFVAICQAVEHAHQRGVIHRDLKPVNVLVSECDGRPLSRIIDFGIATAVSADEPDGDGGLFRTSKLGTPAYMSPEQALPDGAPVDIRCDVFSLGAVLYELLTGQPPLGQLLPRCRSVGEYLSMVRDALPERPSVRLAACHDRQGELAAARRTPGRRLIPLIRGDLDCIVMKCLEKDRSRRYSSVGALVRDIHRHLDRRPVDAHPASSAYRAGKFFARWRAAVIAGGAMLALLVAGLVGTSISAYQATQAFRAEREESERRRQSLYMARMNLAMEAWRMHNLDRMAELLKQYIPEAGQTDLRGFEWFLLWQWSKDTQFATIELPYKAVSAAFSPTGKSFAVGLMDDRVIEFDVGTRKPVRTLGRPLTDDWIPQKVAYTPDGGKLLYTADRQLVVVEAGTGKELARLDARARIKSLAVSSDGGLAAVGTFEHSIRLFDLATFTDARDPIDALPMQVVQSLAFSHRGRRLAASGDGKPIKIWDLDTDQPPIVFPKEPMPWDGAIAFSPRDQKLAVTYGDNWIRTFDVESASLWWECLYDGGTVAVSYSPDDNWLAATTPRGQLLIWDRESRDLIREERAHSGTARCVAFSPDGRWLLTAGTDGAVRLWEAHPPSSKTHIRAEGGDEWARVTSTGDRLVCLSARPNRELRMARMFDLDTLKEISLDFPGQGKVHAMALSPGGQIAVAAGEENLLQIDNSSGRSQPIPFSCVRPARVTALAYSPSGRQLAVGREDGSVAVWDFELNQSLPFALPAGGRINHLAFSPTGDWLAVAAGKRVFLCARQPRGQTGYIEQHRLEGHRAAVLVVEFSSLDGELLATGSADDTVMLWNTASGERLSTLTGHKGSVCGLAFTKDGSSLVSGGKDSAIIFWDLATGQQRLHFEQPGPLSGPSLTFTPDGQTLISGTWGRTIQLWRAGTPDGEGGSRSNP